MDCLWHNWDPAGEHIFGCSHLVGKFTYSAGGYFLVIAQGSECDDALKAQEAWYTFRYSLLLPARKTMQGHLLK